VGRQRNKYGNRRTVVDGIAFDSRAEANRYRELKLLERAGEITTLELQPRFTLMEGARVNGRKIRSITYTADFRYRDGDTMVIEDVKGTETAVFRLKARLLKLAFADKFNSGAWEFRVVRA